MYPVPPGHPRKKHGEGVGAGQKKDGVGVDMRAFQVLGREELLSQLMNAKKKQAASDVVLHQLKAENQR
jgi:hypothetical protein